MYNARVLADSIGPDGIRLITVEATFPRFILAEVNTHRVFSRNSASSRAIPPELQIQRVRENMFMPEAFHSRVRGMGQGAALDDGEQLAAQRAWIYGAENAVLTAENLMRLGISKAHVNRVLEPYMWHTAIITSTDWDNFFALRAPVGEKVDYDFPAQPEFQRVAILMRSAMRASRPMQRRVGSDWHLPLVHPHEPLEYNPGRHDGDKFWAMVSAGRCARVSFEKQDQYEDPEESHARARRLRENGHLSPFEHPAIPGETSMRYENLRGWKSLRHLIPHQENRVGVLNGRPNWEIEA